MKDLEALFTDRMKGFLASGKPEEIIDKALEDAFKKCVNSSFSWGDNNKKIEEMVDKKLNISLGQIEVQSYSAVLERQLNQKMAEFASGDAERMVQTILEGLFKESPAEIEMETLSEYLLDELRGDDPSDYGEHFHVELEESSHGFYTFKIKGGADAYSDKKVHLFLSNKDDHHYVTMSVNMDITNPTCLRGVDKYLFGLYAAKTKILNVADLDVTDLDTRKIDADY